MIHKKNVLTIAGSDSSGGAGIQADIKTFEALNVYSASVITAITAQNTLGVESVYELPTSIFSSQFEAVLSDIHFSAVKVGMLKSVEQVKIVSGFIARYQLKNIVVDPVMISSSGFPLQNPDTAKAMMDLLMPVVSLITPNIPEAAHLLETDVDSVMRQPQRASMQLMQRFKLNAILIKGGHTNKSICEDVLCYKRGDSHSKPDIHLFQYKKQNVTNAHGTGCTLSSAIAAHLAHGDDLVSAIDAAGKFLQTSLKNAELQRVGKGSKPLNHRSGWNESI